MATMTSNIGDIINQHMAMQKLLMQMQSQGGYPIPSFVPQEQYLQEDEVQSQRATFSRHVGEDSPLAREVGVDISSNYASDRPVEAPFGMEDNFPLEYGPKRRPQRSVNV